MFLIDTLPYLLMSITVMIATHHLTAFIDNNFILLVARIAVAAILYIGTAFAARSKELEEIKNFIFGQKARQ